MNGAVVGVGVIEGHLGYSGLLVKSNKSSNWVVKAKYCMFFLRPWHVWLWLVELVIHLNRQRVCQRATGGGPKPPVKKQPIIVYRKVFG